MLSTGNHILDAMIRIAAVLIATGVIWRKVVKPVVHGVAELVSAVPVLRSIAEQFDTNGGASLKDSLNRIESNQAATSSKVDGIITTQAGMGEKLDTLHEYAHANNHRMSPALEQLASAYADIKTDMQTLVAGQEGA